MSRSTLNRKSAQNGEMRDRTTKQRIFFKATVCAVARANCASTDALNEQKIGKLLSTQLQKRHFHGAQLTCLEDRIHFKKPKIAFRTPFRNWVMYRDIEHYFVFPQHANMFMLSIRAEENGKSHFETYKCKTAEETAKLCELVCQACHDPMKRLQNISEKQMYSTLSEVSIHSEAISQPNLNALEDAFDEDEAPNGNLDRCENHAEEDLSPTELRELSPIDFDDSESRQLSPIDMVVEDAVVVKHELNALQSSAPEAEDEIDPCENCGGTTYFDYHPVHGAVLNDDGPIYMYMQRYPTGVGA